MTRKNDIKLLRSNYLRGPNIWTYRPVLETWVDLGELEDWPSNKLDGINARLLAMLPALEEHHCGVGERGGFVLRLHEGTWAGHILEHIVIELLNLAGMPTGFGQTRSTDTLGVYRMVFRARDEQVARSALAQGHALLMAAINEQPFDVAAAVARVREQVDDSYFGPSTAAIVAAATDRHIPHIRLNDGNLVQLGHGARQRRIWTAETDRTGAIAEGIACDKDLTKRLAAACGVPVPEGEVVANPIEAWEAAQSIGLPVVVKPTDGNHARGVSLDLNSQAEVEAAFPVAEAEGSQVLVERYIRGDEHRLLVVAGEVVAAARGESTWITGDGRSTVTQLIDSQLNTDPRRGEAEEFPLETIHLEREPVIRLMLERQGLDADGVPAAGRQVLIQRNGNVAIDCTDDVHPEVAHAAGLAARVVGLDIAGIDLVTSDVSKPLAETGGAIVEVNAGPGLLMHLKPGVGTPRPVGRAIVDHLFPQGDAGRIPIIGVAGSRDTHTIARLVAWLLLLGGRQVGLACRDGLFHGRRRIESGDCAGWEPAHRLLMSRTVDTAVIENDALAILRDGLAYDRCTVGIVTDFELRDAHREALARFDIAGGDQLTKVLRTQVDVVLDDGAAVLHAADERVAALAQFSDGDVVLYGLDGNLPALQRHREQGGGGGEQGSRGGRAVFLRGGAVVLANGSVERVLPKPQHAPFGVAGAARDQAVLAALAAAWALDISGDLLIAGLDTFAFELQKEQGA